MQKIFLKPIAKEISYSSAEPNTHYDGFEYVPRDEKTKHLGHLYIIGHLKHGEENMAYVLNLVSSLAKREYYSENGSIEEHSKKAFDHTLKKINDVLEDFFENKEFQLDLGLVAMAGKNIHIAKLGKFKIFLARSGEMIDILNNVDLFQKELTEEKKFSSVISGKIQEGDKLFALFPTRSLSAREKSIKLSLAKDNQEEFLANLASLRQSAKNFSCGGFHIEIKKVTETEIPIRSAYRTGADIEPVFGNQSMESKLISFEQEEKNESSQKADKKATSAPGQLISSADMSIIRKRNILEKIQEKLTPRYSFKNLNRHRSWKGIVLAMIVLLGGIWGAKMLLQNNPEKSVLHSARENLKLAEIKITQNEADSARDLLGLSLSSLINLKENNEKVEELKGKISTVLDCLDLVSNRQPEIFSSFSNAAATVKKILVFKNNLLAVNQDQKTFKVTKEAQTETSLPELIITVSAKDYSVYEDNLYTLDSRAIYKYADAMTGGKEKKLWLGGLTDADPQNIAVDGNVYILSSNGLVVKYFKGKEEARINLNAKISPASPTGGPSIKMLIGKDSPYIYLADFTNKKIRVFDKTTGSLVMTYKTSVLSSFTDAALGDKVLYLSSGDNQIWKIDLN